MSSFASNKAYVIHKLSHLDICYTCRTSAGPVLVSHPKMLDSSCNGDLNQRLVGQSKYNLWNQQKERISSFCAEILNKKTLE